MDLLGVQSGTPDWEQSEGSELEHRRGRHQPGEAPRGQGAPPPLGGRGVGADEADRMREEEGRRGLAGYGRAAFPPVRGQ